MAQLNNEQVVRRHFENLWEPKGDLRAALEECCVPEVELHIGDESIRGYDGFRNARALILKAFPDIHFTIDEIFAMGDRVAVRWTGKGTHRGEFMGIQPTDKSISYWGLSIYELRSGKIALQWGTADMLTLLAQIKGAKPEFSLKRAA